jgi:molybdate transport system substrate-binding protein
VQLGILVTSMVKTGFMKIADHTIGIALGAFVLFQSQASAEEVKIAVAANFTDANREIASLFEQATGHTTRISYGSTGKLYSQIEHGAPFELFLAADTARPVKAEEAGLAVSGTRFVYAKGKLVLWSLKPGLFKDGQRYLEEGAFERLALANPKTAPYGLAAQQVMRHLGVLEALMPRLVRGESIAQTFQFVATGNAESGFVALAQIKDWKGESGTLWEIPSDHYAPIDQAAVLLKRGEHNPAARAYLEFLRSGAAREVITRYGYGVDQ